MAYKLIITQFFQIVGLIILGVVLDLGGAPTHDRIGFRYWKHPGPFNQLNDIPGTTGRFLAFWATFINAAFSFQGTEIVPLAAGEAENPRRNVPKGHSSGLLPYLALLRRWCHRHWFASPV